MGQLKPMGDWIRGCFVGVSVLVWLAACAPKTPGANRSPVAIAGQDRTAAQGQSLLFSADDSYDPDGDALSYRWTLVSMPAGATGIIRDETNSRSTLVPDAAGLWMVQLTVNDGELPSPPALVRIQVHPASAGSLPPSSEEEGGGGEEPPPGSADQKGKWLYWTADNGLLIERLSLDDQKTRQVIVREEGLVSSGLAVDLPAGKLYWGSVKNNTYVFYGAHLDGRGRTELFRHAGTNGIVPSAHSVQDLVYDESSRKLFFTLWEMPAIYSWSLQTSSLTFFSPGATIKPRGLALDAQKITFTDSATGRIYRVSTNGQGLVQLLEGVPSPIDIEIDPTDGRLLWTDSSLNKIELASVTDMQNRLSPWNGIPGANRPQGLGLDPESHKIYWCDYTQNQIRVTNRDGSQTEDVVSAQGPLDALIVDIP